MIRAEDEILVDDDAQWPSGADRKAGLDIEGFLDDLLTGLVGGLGGSGSDRLDEIRVRT